MRRKYGLLFMVLIIIFGVFIFLKINTPVKIALIGDFTQEQRDFCTTSLFGARIAEEQINKGKGILGRKLEIIPRDIDFSDIDGFFKGLVREHIEIVVSSLNSENLYKLSPYFEKYNILCISANATAASLSGIKDNIYKILPDDVEEVQALFNYLDKKNIEKKFTVIYNKENMKYINSVEREIQKLGGEILYKGIWDKDYELFEIKQLEEVKKSSAIIVLCSATESAFIVQKLHMQGITDKPILGFSWNGDYNLIEYGGKAIEGFTLVTPIDIGPKNNKYTELEKELKKFNKKNSMVTATTYEAIMIAKELMEDKFTSHKSLQNIMLEKPIFKVMNTNISFDQYGDSKREQYIFEVKQGEFSKVEGN